MKSRGYVKRWTVVVGVMMSCGCVKRWTVVVDDRQSQWSVKSRDCAKHWMVDVDVFVTSRGYVRRSMVVVVHCYYLWIVICRRMTVPAVESGHQQKCDLDCESLQDADFHWSHHDCVTLLEGRRDHPLGCRGR